MKTRLKEAGLPCIDDDAEINISYAWSILSRLGLPARYGGRSPEGSYEYIIINPRTGCFLATGKGETLEKSICEAALNACTQLNAN